jgi:hypothetical protein
VPFSDDADAIARALASADVFIAGTREPADSLADLACGTPVMPARAAFSTSSTCAAMGAARPPPQLASDRSLLAAEPHRTARGRSCRSIRAGSLAGATFRSLQRAAEHEFAHR